ncbi:MAG: response regulator [Deltaproteobacteria bacterium]|nr:response regulator [Deltaproteobacteria bacterium]
MVSFHTLSECPSENSKRFVIVDDTEVILQVWSRILAHEPYGEGFLTTDPWDALDEIKTKGADILITDLLMPGMSGFQLAQKAKAFAPDLKVYYTTGKIPDLFNLNPLDETLEILQKPYSNLNHVKSFIHALATDGNLDRSYCEEKGWIHQWRL